MSTRVLARWVELVSWGFAALGVALPWAFHTSAFAPFRAALAAWAYGSHSIPAADEELLGLMLGITGGSITGKWVVHALIARGPLREGRAWPRRLMLRGLALWFTVDSIGSVWLGATFNVWMLNLGPLLCVALPLALSKTGVDDDDRSDKTSTRFSWTQRACTSTSIAGAAAGLAIAFCESTPLFSPWFEALRHAHSVDTAIADSTRRLVAFFFAPIGACTLAQFTMLAGLLRHDGATRRTANAGFASILAWFVVDSGYGLAYGGAFNIVMINAPALIITLPPWLALALSVSPGSAPCRAVRSA